MKKMLLCALLGSLCLSLSAVEYEFSGFTSTNGSVSYCNEGKFINSKNNVGAMNLSQNLNFLFLPDTGLSAKFDATFDLSTAGGFTFNINELYGAWETNGKGNYYFGRRNHNDSVARIFSLSNVMGGNHGEFEALLSNNRWLDFNAGLYYTFNQDPDIKNFNIFLRTSMYNDLVKYTVSTYELHVFDLPKGTFKVMFRDNDALQKKMKEFSDRIEFVTAQTVNFDLGSWDVYGELLIRTNPTKFKVVNNNLTFAGKKGYFDGTLGFAYKNDIVDLAFEYCYAMSGYDHDEIADINKYLEGSHEVKDINGKPTIALHLGDTGLLRSKGPIFYKNNIGLNMAFTLTPKWKLTVGDKVTFPQYGCDVSYIGTKFFIQGDFTYSENLSFTSKFEGVAGGDNNEFKLYDQKLATLYLGAKLSY